MGNDYNKPEALEYIFNQKYDSDNPQPEIPFTRDEVREAIIETDGNVPSNLNNFVKDLTRSGNSDARVVTNCSIAKEQPLRVNALELL